MVVFLSVYFQNNGLVNKTLALQCVLLKKANYVFIAHITQMYCENILLKGDMGRGADN